MTRKKLKNKQMKILFAILLTVICLQTEASPKDFFLLVGTNTQTMYVYRFNATSGKLNMVSSLNINASQYFTVSKNQKFVYVANTRSEGKGGEITALAFDNKTGILSPVNATKTGSEPCCYVDISADGEYVVAANYRLGNLLIFKANTNGSIQPYQQIIDHKPLTLLDQVPHVHCSLFSPDGNYVVATDLGLDKVFCYPFSRQNSQPLFEANALITEAPDGYGPRHLAFHPNGKFLYLISEKSGHLISYKYKSGKLSRIQDQLSDSTNHDGKGASADIHITPNGKFLYVSHRKQANDLVAYKISSSGKLKELFHQSSMGIQPRNFVIDPTGSFLLVANVDTGNIVVFSINRKSGQLTPTDEVVKVGKPFCLKIIE